MKKIEAIIKPYKLEDVREALAEAGISGLTATEVKGYGRQKGHTETYRGAENKVDFLSKVKLEIVLTDDQVERCIEVIFAKATAGKLVTVKYLHSTLNALYVSVLLKKVMKLFNKYCLIILLPIKPSSILF